MVGDDVAARYSQAVSRIVRVDVEAQGDDRLIRQQLIAEGSVCIDVIALAADVLAEVEALGVLQDNAIEARHPHRHVRIRPCSLSVHGRHRDDARIGIDGGEVVPCYRPLHGREVVACRVQTHLMVAQGLEVLARDDTHVLDRGLRIDDGQPVRAMVNIAPGLQPCRLVLEAGRHGRQCDGA